MKNIFEIMDEIHSTKINAGTPRIMPDSAIPAENAEIGRTMTMDKIITEITNATILTKDCTEFVELV
jgi:hypothetical protein